MIKKITVTSKKRIIKKIFITITKIFATTKIFTTTKIFVTTKIFATTKKVFKTINNEIVVSKKKIIVTKLFVKLSIRINN